jgi:chromosome partitioning protein
MKITITSLKGGVGKTTSSIHLAGCLAMRGKTLLIDADTNESSLDWVKAGSGLSFDVVAIANARQYLSKNKTDHIVLDTAAAPSDDSLKTLARDSDLLILPSKPDSLSLRALIKTIQILKAAKTTNYRVLLTMVPTSQRKTGEQAAEFLVSNGIPVFKSQIRQYSAYEVAATNGCLVHQARDLNNRKVSNGAIAWSDYLAVGNEL